MKAKISSRGNSTETTESPEKQKSTLPCRIPVLTTDHRDAFTETERRINKACDQLSVIHSKIRDLQIRRQRALKRQQHSFAKNCEMQLQVLQGVYNMYHMYCSKKAEVLTQLEEEMQ